MSQSTNLAVNVHASGMNGMDQLSSISTNQAILTDPVGGNNNSDSNNNYLSGVAGHGGPAREPVKDEDMERIVSLMRDLPMSDERAAVIRLNQYREGHALPLTWHNRNLPLGATLYTGRDGSPFVKTLFQGIAGPAWLSKELTTEEVGRSVDGQTYQFAPHVAKDIGATFRKLSLFVVSAIINKPLSTMPQLAYLHGFLSREVCAELNIASLFDHVALYNFHTVPEVHRAQTPDQLFVHYELIRRMALAYLAWTVDRLAVSIRLGPNSGINFGAYFGMTKEEWLSHFRYNTDSHLDSQAVILHPTTLPSAWAPNDFNTVDDYFYSRYDPNRPYLDHHFLPAGDDFSACIPPDGFANYIETRLDDMEMEEDSEEETSSDENDVFGDNSLGLTGFNN
jgi:hypothetical protein